MKHTKIFFVLVVLASAVLAFIGNYGYKITDSKNGAKINQGTTEDQLKQRFKYEKK